MSEIKLATNCIMCYNGEQKILLLPYPFILCTDR